MITCRTGLSEKGSVIVYRTVLQRRVNDNLSNWSLREGSVIAWAESSHSESGRVYSLSLPVARCFGMHLQVMGAESSLSASRRVFMLQVVSECMHLLVVGGVKSFGK